MESKLVQNFVNSVNELITSEKERDALFEALKTYQSASDVRKLVQDLKRLLNDPSKLEVYDFIRPLIRPQHQQQYDKLAPNPPAQRLRIVKLRRRANESFGFAVRGGLEHGVGIFVSHVETGSQADQKGLKMGDEIVRVNGFTIAEAIHEEVLNLIKGQDEIELKVNNIGMVPIKQKPTDTVTWQYVDKPGLGKSQGSAEETGEENMVKIFINLRGATSMGCSIISGPKTYPGIFIESVRPGSLGEDYGLQVGDQIMEVNGKSFLNIKHQEAIVEIKGSKELNMVIKKGVGLQLLNLKKKESGGSPMVDKRDSRPVTQEEESQEVICEILEEDQHAVEERRHWEIEHERLKKQKAEEEVRERYRRNEMKRKMEEEERRELEEEQRRLQEQRIRKEEEQQQKLERLRLEQEAGAREEERKKEEKRKREEQARKEEEKRKKQEEEEEKRRQEVLAKKQQDMQMEMSAVLAGRAGPTNSKKPTLLGAAPGAQTSFGKSSSKKVKEVVVILDEGNPTLDIELEGGSDSPIGKIVIADVYPNGSVDKNGEIKRGDQVLKINNKSLEGLSITEANEALWQAEQDCLPGDSVKFVIVESEIRHDEITFF